jgi:hypothetical protein
MGAREQFAGWGLYDNEAICLDCGHHHLIAKAEQISDQPWLDWLHKHQGHVTFIVPHSQLGKLGSLNLAHNADAKVSYAASASYTITLASLGTSSSLLEGRESTALSNATNKYIDELVAGKIRVGTSPTASTQIEVHAVGALDDTPTWPDGFTGSDAAKTITSAAIKAALCAPIAVMGVDATTSDRDYPFRPVGLRQLFGDALPPSHLIWVTHSSAVNLNSTGGNHFIKHTPVYATVV